MSFYCILYFAILLLIYVQFCLDLQINVLLVKFWHSIIISVCLFFLLQRCSLYITLTLKSKTESGKIFNFSLSLLFFSLFCSLILCPFILDKIVFFYQKRRILICLTHIGSREGGRREVKRVITSHKLLNPPC